MEFVISILLNTRILLSIQSVTPGVWLAIILLFALLFCVSAISAAEIAFFSLSPLHLSRFKAHKTSTDQLITELLEQPKKLLATVLIASNFFNVGIVILSTYITSSFIDITLHPVLVFIIQVVVITSIIVLVGEIIPKVYSSANPDRVVVTMAYPVHFLRTLFSPLSTLLVNSTAIIDRRIANTKYATSMEELSDAIDITSDGVKDNEDTQILKSITRFGNIHAREIMRPRVDVVALENTLSYAEVKKTVIDSGYSRIPVFKETIDQITGILYIKDLLSHLDDGPGFKWFTLIRPAFFIPESKPIDDLLLEFREKKVHMAVVADEYGGTSGIITMEDIIEEIVGDINDEFDQESDLLTYKKIDDHNYVFDGKTLLNDLCKIIDVDDRTFEEVKGESDTLAGLLLEISGKMPLAGEVITYMNFIFRIIAADKRRIKRVELTIEEENKEEE